MSTLCKTDKRYKAKTLSMLALCLLTATAMAAPAKKTTKSARKAAPAVAAATAAVAYASRGDAMQLADDIAARRGLPADWVRAQLGEAKNLPVVTRLMTPAGKTFVKNWTVYRSRFIDPVRIRAGVQFWQANRQALARAEQQFGVPAEIIVGIIGVETIYGRNMGNFRVMDALATLTLDFPQSHPRAQARTDYFRGELEQVLITANRTGSDPFAAAMRAPWVWASSCPPVGTGLPSTLMVMAGSTCSTVPPMPLARSQTTSSVTAGSRACPQRSR